MYKNTHTRNGNTAREMENKPEQLNTRQRKERTQQWEWHINKATTNISKPNTKRQKKTKKKKKRQKLKKKPKKKKKKKKKKTKKII